MSQPGNPDIVHINDLQLVKKALQDDLLHINELFTAKTPNINGALKTMKHNNLTMILVGVSSGLFFGSDSRERTLPGKHCFQGIH